MSALPQYQASETPQASENRLPFTEMPFPEEHQIPIRAYFKYELAEIYGVSMPTFIKWLNMHLPDLEALGYHKRMQKLTPRMVRVLVERV